MLLVFSCLGLVSLALLYLHEKGRKKEALLLLSIAEKRIAQIPEIEQQLKEKEELLTSLKIKLSSLEEKYEFVKRANDNFSQTFKALSHEALEKNSSSFLNLANATLEKFQQAAKGDLEKRQQSISEMVAPMKESLNKLDQGLRLIEKERKGEQQVIHEQLRSLLETEKQLRQETASLVKALRSPIARGRWGEIQLRRVVELAGMLNHCDFTEQNHMEDEEGKLRPDLIVHLPGGRQVVVDAKAPLEAYMEAIQTSDETVREAKLKDHARHVRQHITALGKKAYWERFHPTPEFVVLFLPAETFFSAALEFDPSLIEVGVEGGVILATPTTLIALLRSVSYGWKQESLSRHAEELEQLGQELYKRMVDMCGHFTKTGRSLGTAVESFNKAMGSFESRVLVSARKFKEMGATSSAIELDSIDLVEKIPRELQLPETEKAFTTSPE
ncbi:MAG: DNA recombination protein RmuC [Chlamydiales bacterium]|nr:DNA recombination protein RmuC [Chlamydiales bacterium]